MKTEHQARVKFTAYYLDLKESMEAEGGRIGRSEEWDRFIEAGIEEEEYPQEAKSWKCPKANYI